MMKSVDTQRFAEMRDQNAGLTVINVLPEAHFQQAHIAGSKNIPVGNEGFVQDVEDEVGSRDEPVVVYCASEECDASEKAAQKLDDAGFEQVYDYVGGVQAWQEAGKSIERGTGG